MTENLSLVAMFDQIIRNSQILQQQSDDPFLRFVRNAGQNRKRWEHAELECQRLVIELTKADKEINGLEQKLSIARTMLENELSARKKAESERDRLDSQLSLLRQLVLDDQLVDAVKLNKLRQFGSQLDLRSSEAVPSPCVTPKGILKVRRDEESIVDVDDLSFDDTKGFLDSRSRLDRRTSGRKRSRSVGQEAGENILENIASPAYQSKKRNRRSRSVVAFDTETDEVTSSDDVEPLPRSNSAHERNVPLNSSHLFVQKTVMKSDKCSVCDKRIKFGKLAAKCNTCRMMAHIECSNNAPKACSRSSASVGYSSPPVLRTPVVDSARSPAKRTYFQSPMLL